MMYKTFVNLDVSEREELEASPSNWCRERVLIREEIDRRYISREA
jgi:hypothetical protein